MAKKVAVLAVNPVNGAGLFQYLETFFENGIPFRTFAVAETPHIRTNSGVALTLEDTIAHLKGHESEYDAVVFSCGDAIPRFSEQAAAPYNQDMLSVLRAFGEAGKLLIGHCAAALIFDKCGIIAGHKVAVHPLAKPAIQQGIATDAEIETDDRVLTARDEKHLPALMPRLIETLQ